MKLEEAIRSKRPFKRPSWPAYISSGNSEDESTLLWEDSRNAFTISRADFSYNDYVLKEKPKGWVKRTTTTSIEPGCHSTFSFFEGVLKLENEGKNPIRAEIYEYKEIE